MSVTIDHGYVPLSHQNSLLSSFMTYHRICDKSNTTAPIVEQELLTLPEHLDSPSRGFLWGSCFSIFIFL
jgi:hypothetical protein